MLDSTELFELTLSLKVVLWIEAIVYLGLGIFEIFDDFFRKIPHWTIFKGKLNSHLFMADKMQHKFHAAICFFLGFIALNGLVEGAVTRFEIELLFVGLSLIMMLLWMILPPGKRMPIVMLASKPETFLSVAMFLLFSHLIRPEVLVLCVLMNIWGVLVFLFHTRKILKPYNYKALHDDAIDAGMEEYRIKAWDKIEGYQDGESEGNEQSTR